MLERKVLEAAATWYVQLHGSTPNAAERQAWQSWHDQDSRHAKAWARVEKLQSQLGALPQEVALPALAGVRARRRAVNTLLGLLLASGATGWGLQLIEPWPSRLASVRTGKGERRELLLADGGRVFINTHTALAVNYSASLRELRLYQGEILVETAADPTRRPFIVHTAHGSVQALGTRFSVRAEASHSEVRVTQHAVQIRPADQPQHDLHLEAGQQALFDPVHVSPPSLLPANSDAWLRGMLMVVDWHLGALLEELARYRPGVLRCSTEVAGLRVSGGFSLDNTDTILENLAASLPIKVHYLTRYWVFIEAA